MRFSNLVLAAALVAAVSFVACTHATASGDTSTSGASSMSADGGMGGSGSMSADGGMGSGSMSADGGMAGSMGSTMGAAASDMGAAAGQAGRDMKAGAQAAGHEVAGMASGAADAGMQAAGSAASAAKDTASSAASSAAGAASGAAASAAADTKPAGPTDAQIAAIVVAANTVDINAGKLAAKSGHDAKVKKFAKDMIKDHTANNKAAAALVKKLGVTPEENDTSKSLTDGGQKNLDNLKTLKGKDFDKAYVDNEVSYHQAVVDAIDNTLIPNAKNEELKALLTKTSPVIKEHLEHAKMLQSSMAGGK